MTAKKRLDVLLFEKNYVNSRAKAKELITTNKVLVNGESNLKPSDTFDENVDITILEDFQFVSRGGLKLCKAIELYSINLTEKVCMDIGASTGGFTDCMLQNGAAKVFAVDVGFGQLHKKLINNSKVINMEKTNIRYITYDDIGEYIDFISVDVSFISLKLVIPAMKTFLKESGEAVMLIKPQFEAGKKNVGKKGVVKDKKVHLEVCQSIYNFLIENELSVKGFTFSPIKGPEGNIEYLVFVKNSKEESTVTLNDINEVINSSHDFK